MATHLAFLRAINLGARRKFPKTEIKAAVESAGFTAVETHINTGNVRFETRMRSRARIEKALEQAFRDNRDFEVPTIVFSAPEFAQVALDADELHHEDLSRHYVWLLKEPLDPATHAEVEQLSTEQHRAVVRGRVVHLLLGLGYQQATVDPLRVERLLGVATNRNYNVVTTIARKWC